MYRWSDVLREINKCDLLCKNCHNEKHCSAESKAGKIKEKLLDLKGVRQCRCGHSGHNLASLDFHHKDNVKKEFKISDYLFWRSKKISWEMVLLELDKCEVLCSNCHLLEHFDMERFERLKPLIDEKMKGYREKTKPLNRNIVRSMLKNGMKQIEIARHFGCSKSTVCDIIRKRQHNEKLQTMLTGQRRSDRDCLDTGEARQGGRMDSGQGNRRPVVCHGSMDAPERRRGREQLPRLSQSAQGVG